MFIFFTKTFILTLLLAPVIFANSRLLLDANGDIREMDQKEAIVLNKLQSGALRSVHVTPFSLNKTMNIIDTLNYGGGWNVNFGFYPQDVMLQFFQAPADLYIDAVSFTTSNDAGYPVEVKIVKVNWTMAELMAAGTAHWGYYEAAGNGYNDASPFVDNLDVTGGWVDKSGSGMAEPFGPGSLFDLAGFPIEHTEAKTTYWIDMLTGLGYRPDIKRGEIFAVAVKHTNTNMAADERASLQAKDAGGGIYGWKYYANGRLETGVDYGWWSRDGYVWNVTAAVELYGDRAPIIKDITYPTIPYFKYPPDVFATITDDNPSGGPAGVASATLCCVINDETDTLKIAMVNTTGDEYMGTLPGGASKTTYYKYWVEAIDVEGLKAVSQSYSYSVVIPYERVLFVYDDISLPIDLAVSSYWYGINDSIWAFDVWQADFGPITKELLDNYEYVIHIMGGGPVNKPSDIGAIYKSWLDDATEYIPRSLFLSAQDYGYISGFSDTTFVAGTFEYDYLGIETLGPQDINYDPAVGAPSYQNPYRVDAVSGNLLTGHIAAYTADSLFLFYSPYDELGFDNWIDNLTPVASAVVDITDLNNAGAAVAIHNEGPTFKTVFWTVDPVGLNMFAADTTSSYKRVITDVGNPLVNVMEWFGAPIVSIERIGEHVPQVFTLKQNYPNPFNPSTKIGFIIPNNCYIELNIYSILGQKVKTLVKEKLNAGVYNYLWNGKDRANRNAASGLYFYRLQITKPGGMQKELSGKMLLIR